MLYYLEHFRDDNKSIEENNTTTNASPIMESNFSHAQQLLHDEIEIITSEFSEINNTTPAMIAEEIAHDIVDENDREISPFPQEHTFSPINSESVTFSGVKNNNSIPIVPNQIITDISVTNDNNNKNNIKNNAFF